MKRLLAVSLCVLAGFVSACALFVASVSLRPAGAGSGVPNGDVDGDGSLDVSDRVYLLVHLFKGGQPPVACADTPELVARVAALEDTNARIADALEELAHPCRERLDRFVDNGDGTVTDTCTGLIWQKNTADLDGNGRLDCGDRVTWDNATAYCDGLEFAGQSDWRMPTLQELESTLAVRAYGNASLPLRPAADPIFGVTERYWTATETALNAADVWVVSFLDPSGSNPGHFQRSRGSQGLPCGEPLVLAVRGP